MAYLEEEEYKKPFSLKVWAKIIPFVQLYKKNFISAVGFLILISVIDVTYPLFQRYAINNFIIPASVSGIGRFTFLYSCVLLLQVIAVIVFIQNSMIVELNVAKAIRKAAFVHLQKLSFSYYNTTPVGYMMARVMSDTGRIGQMVSWGMTDILWAVVYVLGVFIAMLFLNFRLALLVMCVIPIIALITMYFQKKILNVNRKIRKINSRLTGAFNEGITGASTSKTLVIEDKNLKDFSVITDNFYNSSIRATVLNAVFIPIVLCFSTLAVCIVLVRGGYLVINDAMEFGTLSVFITYGISIFEPIQQIARVFADFVSTQANIERVTGLIETQPDITDTPEVIETYGDSFNPKRENWEAIKGDIEFRNVSFKYPDGDEYILKDFNLTIPAGTTVAIVGETGAGKSTLVNLACRFFEPTEGHILIDGKDYKERSQLWLHTNIGYVLQSPHLFSGTVRENIKYGRASASEEEIEAAIKAVSAQSVIDGMENGLDTNIGEGGDRLSTGEKQLISFARAIIADPRIFVLDEATSSIDTQTEQLIQDAIMHILKNRTSFLIAHRLSTIKKADIILVVKNGNIIERGTHKELLKQKGYYHSLYQKQFEEETGASVLNN
ncbi:ATP-binding cassette subfamily B protein [Ruminiclostridium sufflavum DSM 19573]|uniref:ATP-binding cassette subfamily B protein n=1 Tax=Ruminiclostridium sufflavum DSM 19573 TaxID=1121337 RepID=A0A318XM32_9FIRM|nr:ABC transporter ATP-binding protein [Ruminiclostridium sufflavum]PYG87608.1 ATP-binding cassette subfamily B protein [Ruminiclostridium sufflavum DSM 19573]